MHGLFLVYMYIKYALNLKVKIKSVLSMRRYWIKLYCPKVVIHISIDHPSTVEDYKMLGGMRSICLMSPTEVFATPDPKDVISKYDYKELIYGALLPGERTKDILIENDKIFPNQAFVVGYPTLDWSNPELRRYFLSQRDFKRKNNIAETHKIILLISSFSVADMNFSKWEKDYFNLPKSLTKKRVEDFSTDAKEMRIRAISDISQLLADNPNWHLIIRKHPFENSSVYEKILSGQNQITYAPAEMDIHDLLSVSDVVVHWNSTVSVQAWIFDKPTILLHLEKQFFLNKEEEASENGNYICFNKQQLNIALSEALDKGTPFEQIKTRKEFLNNWFDGADGKSSVKIANLVARLAKQDIHVSSKLSVIDIIRGIRDLIKYKSLFTFIRILRLLNLKPKISAFMKTQKQYDYFNLDFFGIRMENRLKNIVPELFNKSS